VEFSRTGKSNKKQKSFKIRLVKSILGVNHLKANQAIFRGCGVGSGRNLHRKLTLFNRQFKTFPSLFLNEVFFQGHSCLQFTQNLNNEYFFPGIKIILIFIGI